MIELLGLTGGSTSALDANAATVSLVVMAGLALIRECKNLVTAVQARYSNGNGVPANGAGLGPLTGQRGEQIFSALQASDEQTREMLKDGNEINRQIATQLVNVGNVMERQTAILEGLDREKWINQGRSEALKHGRARRGR